MNILGLRHENFKFWRFQNFRFHDQKLQNVINELERLSEDLTQSPKPGSRPGSLKRKASQ